MGPHFTWDTSQESLGTQWAGLNKTAVSPSLENGMCVIQGPSEESLGWLDSQLSSINPLLGTPGSLWPPPVGRMEHPQRWIVGSSEETSQKKPNSEDLQDRKKLSTVNSFLMWLVPGCTLWRTSLFSSPTRNTSIYPSLHAQITSNTPSKTVLCPNTHSHTDELTLGVKTLLPGHFFKSLIRLILNRPP